MGGARWKGRPSPCRGSGTSAASPPPSSPRRGRASSPCPTPAGASTTRRGLTGGGALRGGELPPLPVDFLVPAALEGQITGQIASGVRARVIVEGANGP